MKTTARDSSSSVEAKNSGQIFHLDTASNPDAQNLPDTLAEADTLSASQALAEGDPADTVEKDS